MAPVLRSITREVIQAHRNDGIEDQLKDWDPPLFDKPYTPPPTCRGRRARPPPPAAQGRQAILRAYENQAQPDNTRPRLVGNTWVEMSDEVWEEMCAEEERGRKARRAARLRAERRRGLGREKKKWAFLGGRKGKVVEGGRRRHGVGAVAANQQGVMEKAGGRFKARGA